MFATTLKTVAIATAVVIATAGSSMAATYAWADNDAKIWSKPSKGATQVNAIEEGQKVKIIDKYKSYYKLSIPGQDGWTHADNLYFEDLPGPGPFPFPTGDFGYGYGGSFCVEGKSASFCLSGGY